MVVVHMPHSAQYLGLTEAAAFAGVHRDTIRRRLYEGTLPGASKDAAGAWRIPVSTLVAEFDVEEPVPVAAAGPAVGAAPVDPAAVIAALLASNARLVEIIASFAAGTQRGDR